MSDLEKRFIKAIEDRKFTIPEFTGFAKDPTLALLAGAAIGYGIALDDYFKENKGVVVNSVFDLIQKGE